MATIVDFSALITAFFVGLLGSGHCFGMCGGLIDDVPSCQALVDDIMGEAEQIINGRLASIMAS